MSVINFLPTQSWIRSRVDLHNFFFFFRLFVRQRILPLRLEGNHDLPSRVGRKIQVCKFRSIYQDLISYFPFHFDMSLHFWTTSCVLFSNTDLKSDANGIPTKMTSMIGWLIITQDYVNNILRFAAEDEGQKTVDFTCNFSLP